MIYSLTASASVASFSMIILTPPVLDTVIPANLIDSGRPRIRIITEAARGLQRVNFSGHNDSPIRPIRRERQRRHEDTVHCVASRIDFLFLARVTSGYAQAVVF